jgi:protocatechuate 3,4-dioxygenase beta subunit
MKTSLSFWHQTLRLFIAALLLSVLVACDGQATPQPAGIPVTGLTATATNPAPAPATQPVPTQPATAAATAPAAACTSPAKLTPAVTEGPFFKAGSPERSSLVEGSTSGQMLTVTGYVLTADCQPVAHALLDFWQADAQGQYDNAGYSLRGHQYTDQNGRYLLETIVPGLYPGRTEHIHVKVQAPGGPLLTTQLFFPGVADNQSDGIYDPALLVKLQASGSPWLATYDFVVSAK